MLRIGLTGGIASGKSAASDCFSVRGIPVIDADVVARQVVKAGTPAIQEIEAAFGKRFIRPDGSLDRRLVRSLIFSDPQKRNELEAILHPRIKEAMLSRLARISAPYCILAIPLLIEADQRDLVDRVLVIDAPRAIQIKRLMQRDQISQDEAEAILNTQLDRDTRVKFADDLIVNDGSQADLEAAIEGLHQKYLSLATAD
ncbi:MAG: dephospho-CoA kinase [Proteobacteria bacterium]|nr:MAG: dephospho-CoA kinase [Pseudomonadota bacterium]